MLRDRCHLISIPFSALSALQLSTLLRELEPASLSDAHWIRSVLLYSTVGGKKFESNLKYTNLANFANRALVRPYLATIDFLTSFSLFISSNHSIWLQRKSYHLNYDHGFVSFLLFTILMLESINYILKYLLVLLKL